MNNSGERHFLTHVNALRGLAILLVFIYHLQEKWCPNGYLGVDAFFVISGFFLIPGLLKITDKGRWRTLADYYRKKFLRIVPPVAVTVLLVILVAVLGMVWQDALDTSRTALSVMTGVSNILLGVDSVDYFSPQVKDNVLLHTWYISVLVQILLIAPLVLLPLVRMRPAWKYTALSALMILSMLIFFQEWLPTEWQTSLPECLQNGKTLGSSYYMTLGRLWQVLAGFFILTMPACSNRSVRTLLLGIGIALLLTLSFDHQSWTWKPLLAVAATMIIIRYGENTWIDPVFQNKGMMVLGTISFSFYLIHWPAIAIVRYVSLTTTTELPLTQCCVSLLLACLFSYLLYFFVEKRRTGVLCTFVLWAVALGSAYVVYVMQGMKDVLHTRANSYEGLTWTEYQDWKLATRDMWDADLPANLQPWREHFKAKSDTSNDTTPRLLHLGNPQFRPNFVLVGDSLAYTLFPGMDIVGKQENWSGLYLNSYIFPFWGGDDRKSSQKVEGLIAWLTANPHLHYVIISQSWVQRCLTTKNWQGKTMPIGKVFGYTTTALRQFCQELQNAGKEVLIIGCYPQTNFSNRTFIPRLAQRSRMWYQPHDRVPDISLSYEQYHRTNDRINKVFMNMEKDGLCKYLRIDHFLFHNGLFTTVQNGELFLFDNVHTTVFGSTRIAQGLIERLSPILKQTSPPQGMPDKTNQ